MDESGVFSYPIDTIRQLLKLSLTDRQFFLEMRGLVKPEFFANRNHAHIYQYMVEFFEKYRECPGQPIMVSESKETFTGDAQMFDLEMAKIYEATPQNVPWLKDSIMRFVKEYTIRQCLEKTLELANGKHYDAIPEVWKAVLKVCPNNAKTYLFQDVGTWMTTLAKHSTRISTGIEKLDKVLEGGWDVGELNVYMAKTNVGKSIFLMHSAHAAIKAGKFVYFASCEMSKEKVARRFLVSFSGQVWEELLAHYMSAGVSDITTLFGEFKANLQGADACIEKYSPGVLTAAMLQADIISQQTIVGRKFDMVVVDYMDEMSPNGGGQKNPYEDQRLVAQELIAMAEDLKIVLVTATQAQRSAGKVKSKEGATLDKMIEPEEVGDCYWIARLAHSIVTLNQTQSQRAMGRIDLYAAKIRDGEKGQTIPCILDYPRMKVTECPSVKSLVGKISIGGGNDTAS